MPTESPTIHLHPTAPLAERVLLPGDPGRALRLAQELLDGPKMFNHNRGLWGYTGPAPDGEPLTIQSTGIGGPSTAIVATELIELGARRLVRVGTCRALASALELGRLVIATDAIADDGAGRALGAGPGVASDPVLLAALLGAGVPGGSGASGAVSGRVVSTDLFYEAGDHLERWRAAGAIAVDLESAALLGLARRRGVQAACVLLVAHPPGHGPALDSARLEADALHEAELRLGRLGFSALQGGAA